MSTKCQNRCFFSFDPYTHTLWHILTVISYSSSNVNILHVCFTSKIDIKEFSTFVSDGFYDRILFYQLFLEDSKNVEGVKSKTEIKTK